MSVDVFFWYRELFISYKFGEKERFRKSLDIIKPYLNENHFKLLDAIYDDSLWLKFHV